MEEESAEPSSPGNVDVVPLGFVTDMAAHMAAADVLVTKAGPGSIAEAAAVGLPVMLTRYVTSTYRFHRRRFHNPII